MSHLRTRAGGRAYTIAELLVVFVIMGFVASFVALIVGPLFTASHSQAAKVDTIQTAEKSFYRIQRDLHQTNFSGVYVCTYPGPTACSTPSPTLTNATVVAIITPKKNGSGQVNWDPNQAQPNWQGFNVYWLAPDATGALALNYSFAPTPVGANPSAPSAEAAVNLAFGTPQLLASGVTELQLDVSAPNKTIGLKMFATATESNSANASSFESDTFTRN
jgi:type II secretory pathway pseudopilin PulG